MARSLSSQKRMRQNVRRAARNKTQRSLLKSRTRRVTDAIGVKDAANVDKLFRELSMHLDRAGNKGLIHRNTAARRKSRLARRINALKGKSAAKH